MAATVHVVARYLARTGREDELKSVLIALVAPSRREVECYQYDLLSNPADPRDFCFVERWGSDEAVNQHARTPHVQAALGQAADLVEAPPDVRRYRIL